MGIFFDFYFRIIDKIESQYHTPISPEFRCRNFGEVRWAKAEHRNFFTIIKILAERGASTVNEIVNADGFSQKFRDKSSRYITYRRIIVGDQRTKVIGLIKKAMVTEAKSEDKLHKKYELTHNGIMYAIKLFMDTEIVFSGNYKDMLKWDDKVGWYDYSAQTKFPETIIDTLARNYSHVLPLIFGKWDYLKNNPRIDAYILYEIAALKQSTKNLMNDNIAANCKYSIEFTTFDGDISLEFYTRQIEHAHYSPNHFFKSIDDKEIEKFIEKIFYSYERLYKESYYRSQSGYWQYKGDTEKAKKFAIKSVDYNDMITKKEKEKFKKNYSKQRDFGIKFCK